MSTQRIRCVLYYKGNEVSESKQKTIKKFGNLCLKQIQNPFGFFIDSGTKAYALKSIEVAGAFEEVAGKFAVVVIAAPEVFFWELPVRARFLMIRYMRVAY